MQRWMDNNPTFVNLLFNLQIFKTMSKNSKVSGQTLNAQTESTLAIELFLNENYAFRRNVLNGKVEFAEKQPAPDELETTDGQAPADDQMVEKLGEYRVLTKEALNSIVIRAKREEICEKGSPKQSITDYVGSEEVPTYNPIQEYLNGLPQWDGHNYVADLLSRLPGLTSEKEAFLAIWLRSMSAHWQQLDSVHGNECVLTLIGAQGCGKTTFLRLLLPPHLREYYLDHLNLSNKFDKEMALTNNLLVNLDEMDAITASQHAMLKQTLSKNKVNGRPIFGRAQEDRPRYASFSATTNNPHPLTDPTGSRRFICVRIPEGKFIDNTGDINYEQLYAQLVYEVNEQKTPYWFNNEEVSRLQELNQEYMQQKDIDEIISICFRKPEEGERVKPMNSSRLLKLIRNEYPSVPDTQSSIVKVALAMRSLGFTSTPHAHSSYYYAVPKIESLQK